MPFPGRVTDVFGRPVHGGKLTGDGSVELEQRITSDHKETN
uniref:Uncharacterized protein n=1 Tax=Caenorhabditis japonica TaxID=281687 RepID=A0A8R1EEZ0_CAEJA